MAGRRTARSKTSNRNDLQRDSVQRVRFNQYTEVGAFKGIEIEGNLSSGGKRNGVKK